MQKIKKLLMRRTCPSVFDKIKEHAKDVTVSANLVEKVSKSTAEKGIKAAKCLGQVKNHLYKARRESRLSKDDVYNVKFRTNLKTLTNKLIFIHL